MHQYSQYSWSAWQLLSSIAVGALDRTMPTLNPNKDGCVGSTSPYGLNGSDKQFRRRKSGTPVLPLSPVVIYVQAPREERWRIVECCITSANASPEGSAVRAVSLDILPPSFAALVSPPRLSADALVMRSGKNSARG